MKKLKAFTLIEVLVSMAISGIVVTASYFCYSIVTDQFSTYRAMNVKTMDIVLLRSLLEQDINSLSYMKARSGFEIEMSDEKKMISYSFENSFITRSQGTVTDTFMLHTGGLQLLFKKKKPQSVSRIINELSFVVQFPDTSYTMHFVKEYDPGVLMKQELTEINF